MPASYMNINLEELRKNLNIKNPMATPKISKIVVNMGVKDAVADKKNLGLASGVLSQITGQKPKVVKAKKSIATFKLRKGEEIAVMVTLRGKRMYDFFDKVVSIVLPRLRDFHGVRYDSFDGKGNYTLGFTEYTVFPEIDSGKVEKVQGFEVCIVTTAKNDKEGIALLTAYGMPFIKNKSNKGN